MRPAFLPILPAAVAMLFAAYAAVCDVRTRRIPNRLVLLCLPAVLLSQFAAAGWRGAAGGVAAGMIALALMSIGFLLGGMGAGDVKLMSVMGAFTGLHALALLMIATALAGGALCFFLVARTWLAERRLLTSPRSGRAALRSLTVPYALPIACGVFTVLCDALRGLAS